MSLFITGGSGFVGSYFREHFRKSNLPVVFIDIQTPKSVHRNEQFHLCDIREPEKMMSLMKNCKRVLHLAAAHHDYGLTEATYRSVNVDGATNICKAMDANQIADVCFFSSVAVYGDAKAPLTEDATPLPQSSYGKTKLEAEGVFANWVQENNAARTLVIRPSVVFGPKNFANMFSLIRQIDRGFYVNIGKANNLKSLCYVENLVDVCLHLWNASDTRGIRTFNYVDKPDLTSREIAHCIHTAMKRRQPRLNLPYSFARCLTAPLDLVTRLTGKNFPVSGARIKKLFLDETKFEADRIHAEHTLDLTAVEKGISNMVDWYLQEGKSAFENGEFTPSLPPETVTIG